jgi:hypothetical protein
MLSAARPIAVASVVRTTPHREPADRFTASMTSDTSAPSPTSLRAALATR